MMYDDSEELLREMHSDIKEIKKDFIELRIDVEKMKVKSGVWGLLAGLIPAIGLAVMFLMSK